MDAEATKPPDTVDTVTPHSGSVTGPQNENQQNQQSMAYSKQCAQETSPSLELESVEGMEPKGTETLNADANTQNLGRDEGAGAGESKDQTQKVEVKIPLEHARLDPLLSQIPKKAQHGLLMQCDLILTCIDATELYIALGTNIGLTFLYNRQDHSMQRLKSETSSDVITCVKLHHGVDHQLATGMASGILCIFFIPSYMSLHKQQLQKFDVRSVHRHYITCVEWSTNGMKLFSGDKTGHVVATEVDFYQGQCKSSELLVEPPTEVVQLNYDHKVLLVSTKQRSFICRLDTTFEIIQIGQQERKVQGNFGACFVPGLCKVEDAVLYAARPGCRVWLSDTHGTVCNTHIFKDHVGSGVREIPILRPSRSLTSPKAELQFGQLLMYRDKQLITYNTTTLFVLDPQKNQVVASQNRLGGIVGVAVHKDEVFVLRRHTEDMVIRIADAPEMVYHKALPFDLPLVMTTTSKTTAVNDTNTTTTITTTTTATSETTTAHRQEAKEESKTKTFFKKTFFTPFKKLDNFIQEHTQSKDSHRHPPPNVNPVIKSGAESSPTKSTPNTSRRESEDSSSDLPPVVVLDSPDLAVRVFSGGRKGPGTVTDIQSPDSADSALSVFDDEVGDKQAGGVSNTTPGASGAAAVRVEVSGPENEDGGAAGQGLLGPIADHIDLSASPAGGNDDIVFTHHMQKKKAKKKKHKDKGSNKEPDSISQSSYGSQVSEEHKPENDPPQDQKELDVLRRAEEALTSVGKLLKGGGDKDKTEEHPGSRVPASEAAATVEDSTLCEGDQADSASLVASSQTLVEESAAVEGLGAVPETQNAAAADAGKNAVCVAVADQRDGKPANTAVQPLSDKALHLSCHTHVQPSGDAVTGPSAVPGDVPSVVACADGEDPLTAAEKTLDSMTKYTAVSVKKEDSVDDFYSMFSAPYSPTDLQESPTFTPKEHRSFSDFECAAPEADWQISTDSGGTGSEKSLPEPMLHKVANSWSEFTAPANIYSLGLSSTHIWFTDKGESLYYSMLGGTKGIRWRKVGEPANQISVSPSGHIVWRLYRGRVFAGTKITQRRPEGLKWVEAVRDVAHISADDNCAWYVKTNGDVMMQRGLSKERPCFRSLGVKTDCPVKQVMARHGVVWAITETLKLLVRTGISNETPQGLHWREIDRHSEPFLFSSVTVDNEGIGWAVDVLGQIWFTDTISPSNPVGSGHWWQVPLSEYYLQNPSVLDMIRSIAKKFDTQKLSHIMSSSRGGLIVAGVQGVWLSLDYLNTLYVCRSSLQGYHWSPAQPSLMAMATVWKQVQASVADLDWGMVWAQQVNGELYATAPDSSDASLVASPVFVSYSVNSHTVWGLTSEGEIYIRTGMGPHCPLGVDWTTLDLSQLGENYLVHLSCNSSFVWVVDSDGMVFHRIGAAAPKAGQLNPAWLPIDTYSEIIFTKVVNGPVDWMVWAVDNRRLTYVRVGITDAMPIGREWVHVPGIQVMDISVSSSGVWALNTDGEILFRYGITEDDVSGNYWKKIPGCFTKVSASSTDVLWAVDTTGQLVKCSSRHLFRRQDSADPLIQRSFSNTGSEEGDWELV